MATRKPVSKVLAKPSLATKAAAKTGIATQAAGVTSVADAKPVKRAVSKERVAATAQARDALEAGRVRRPGVKTVAQKVAATEKVVAVPRGKVMTAVANPRLGKAVPTKTVKAKDDGLVKHKGFVIPTKRKSGDSEEGVPTIPVFGVADTLKVLEKLPKGCTWLGAGDDKHTLSLFNKGGALIAELRHAAK